MYSDNFKTAAWQGFTFFCDAPETNINQTEIPKLLSDDMLRLSEAKVGDRVRIVELYHPEACILQLTSMGFIPGVELEIISHTTSGSVIIFLNNQSIGLGADIAHNMAVKK